MSPILRDFMINYYREKMSFLKDHPVKVLVMKPEFFKELLSGEPVANENFNYEAVRRYNK